MKSTKPIIHGRDHLVGGADPMLPSYPTGDTMDEKILAAGPAGFWKLNESSGHVAADSSGFGQDLSTTSPELDPLWGHAAGPPGEQAADFQNGVAASTASRVSRPWPTLTGSFTAGIWVNRNDDQETPVMGQGDPTITAGANGWELSVSAHVVLGGGDDLPLAWMAGLPSGGALFALNPLLAGSWVFLAIVYDAAATVCKFYVNGLLQATSAPFTFVPAAGTTPRLWVGHEGATLGRFVGSYAFLVNRAMSGTELEGIVGADAASTPPPDPEGNVLTVGPDGNPVWQPPGVTVEHGDGTPDPAPVTGSSSEFAGTPTSSSGWHLQAHLEEVVLYDSSPGRFDVPTMKWTRVPFNTIRIWRQWEPIVGGPNVTTAWLPEDRGLTPQARDGIIHIGPAMAGTPDPVDGSHHSVSSWAWSMELPNVNWRQLPNSPVAGTPGYDPAIPDAYVRAARIVDLAHGFVLRAAPGSSLRRFFEWNMWQPADGIPDWVDYSGTDNPYPIYPVWADRPLVLPGPYPKLTEAQSRQAYAPMTTFNMHTTLTVGSNVCVQAWQDSPWLLRFSTDTYRIPYPGLQPEYVKRPHLVISYYYDPETIDHTTGKAL